MTVLCVNSTVVYSDITAADAGEAGIDYGVPTRFEQTGASISIVGFSPGDYPSLFIYTATAGEETTGDINVGAQAARINVATPGTISNLRTGTIDLDFSGNSGSILLNVVSDLNNSDMEYRNSLNYEITNCIFYNASDAFRSGSTNNNAIATNCTVIDTTGFGFLRPRTVDCVALNTSSAAYFQEGASSSNYWADDGTGDNAITESTPTDIFEDYAGGDYRIKASSSVGQAGAGAFINSPSGITGTLSVTLDDSVMAASGTVELPVITGSLSVTLDNTLITASGVVDNSGSLNQTLIDTASIASGIVKNRGSLAVTLSNSVLSAAGTVEVLSITGSLSVTLDGSELVASGTVEISTITGTLSVTLDNSILAASGDLKNNGSLSQALDDATLAASGFVQFEPVTGTLSVTLDNSILSASGIVGTIITIARNIIIEGNIETLTIKANLRSGITIKGKLNV